jgi:hypothetical protein
MSTWPFLDPRNVATFTVRQIVKENHPILLVNHDAEDGSWQFLTGGPLDMADAMLVGLEEMVMLDATLLELADLPEGWQASREHQGQVWHRARNSSA